MNKHILTLLEKFHPTDYDLVKTILTNSYSLDGYTEETTKQILDMAAKITEMILPLREVIGIQPLTKTNQHIMVRTNHASSNVEVVPSTRNVAWKAQRKLPSADFGVDFAYEMAKACADELAKSVIIDVLTMIDNYAQSNSMVMDGGKGLLTRFPSVAVDAFTKIGNTIDTRTGRGKPNVVITNETGLRLFENSRSALHHWGKRSGSVSVIGSVYGGAYTVVLDGFNRSSDAIFTLAYKGKGDDDAGLIYCPHDVCHMTQEKGVSKLTCFDHLYKHELAEHYYGQFTIQNFKE